MVVSTWARWKEFEQQTHLLQTLVLMVALVLVGVVHALRIHNLVVEELVLAADGDDKGVLLLDRLADQEPAVLAAAITLP
jgi:hypothetical protein